MPIHIVKTSYSQALKECQPDAVFKTLPYTEGHPEYSIEVTGGDETSFVISGYLPPYMGEECHGKIRDIYLDAFRAAGQQGCKSILVSVPYDWNPFAQSIKLSGIVVKASYEALISNALTSS